MINIVVAVAFLLVAGTAHSDQGYTWFDKARDSYIQIEIRLNGISSVCGSVAYVGWAAAVERNKGRGYRSVIQDGDIYESWDHPLVDMRVLQSYAISFAFENPSYSKDEINREIKFKCERGKGEFSEAYETLMNSPISPDPSEAGVLEFACQYYGNWVGFVAHARDNFDQPLWFALERRASTGDKVIPYTTQLVLIESIYSNLQYSSDEMKDLVEQACLNREGVFQ